MSVEERDLVGESEAERCERDVMDGEGVDKPRGEAIVLPEGETDLRLGL